MGHQPENEPRGVHTSGGRAAILRNRLAKEYKPAKEYKRGKMLWTRNFFCKRHPSLSGSAGQFGWGLLKFRDALTIFGATRDPPSVP